MKRMQASRNASVSALARPCGLIPVALALSACGGRTPLDEAPSCDPSPPTCVAPSSDPILGGCGAPTVVRAMCSNATHRWSCPRGARLYERAADAAATCLPFGGAGGIWGVGDFARIPIDNGRCLWVAGSSQSSSGTQRNVAFEPDLTAPFGTCPTQSLTTPTPVVTMSGGDDPNYLVQVNGGFRLGGVTRVMYRLFKIDPASLVGVTEWAGGIGRWDAASRRVVIPAPTATPPWGLDLDLGDALLPASDGSGVYLWGCAQANYGFLLQGCEVARFGAAGTVELFTKGGSWEATTDSSQGAVLFGSGTWSSSVVRVGGGLRHIYVPDYGNAMASQGASDVTGPWSEGPSLGACDLPAGDPKSFCAGPIVHEELADPLRPGELPVTYSIGTTGTPDKDPAAYAARLVWVP